MKIKRTWLTLATVAALGIGALAVPALAQDVDDGRAEQQEIDGPLEHDGLRVEIKDRAKEILAEELGVSLEDLEAAREATRDRIQEEFADEFEARRQDRRARLLERIDDAVENGRITEEEAEVLRERFESGDFPFDGPHPRRRGHRGLGGPGFLGGGGGPFSGGAPLGDVAPIGSPTSGA